MATYAGDPTISLGVRGGDSGPMQAGWSGPAGVSGAGSNPLSTIGNLVETQSKVQRLRAQQLAGQIIAASPDMASAVTQMQQNPIISSFAPDLISTYVSANQALTTTAGEVQRQGLEAHDHFMRNLPALMKNPGNFEPFKAQALALTSPAAKPGVAQAIDLAKRAWTEGPGGEALPPEQVQQNMYGSLMGSGAITAIPYLYGAPDTRSNGRQIFSGVTAPAAGGLNGEAPGSFSSGNALGLKIGPQLAPAGAIPYGDQGGGGQPAAPAPSTPSSLPISVDGQPLVAPDYKPRVPGRVPGVVGGIPIGPAGEIATGLAHDFMSKGLEGFRSATASLPLLDEIDADLDNMAKLDPGQKTNFMVPGAAGELRVGVSKGINTLAQILGNDTVVDPNKIAHAEDLMKATQRMGPSVLQSLLGQQREAAETIKNMNEKGVPGIDNSYLGGKLMTAGIRQATQRVVDMRNFENWWQGQTGGDLTGAEEEFNRLHPASGYMRKALDQFGLTPSGFRDKAALEDSVRKGYLTPKQAYDQAVLQGFVKKKE